MHFPDITNLRQSRDSISNFAGLNVTNTCQDNEFVDVNNMSLRDYPFIRTRNARKRSNYGFTNIKGILGGDKIYAASTDKFSWIDAEGLHQVPCTLSDTPKKLVKMGAYICIFPDKKVFDGTGIKDMESVFSASSAQFTLTDATGKTITYHDSAYYNTHAAQDGDYLITEVDGVSELQRYAKTSGAWYVVTTSYIQITMNGIGNYFKEGDGVKITVSGSVSWDEGQKLFTETDGEGNRYATYTIKSVSTNAITIGGILKQNKTFSGTVSVKRECPDIVFVTEAMNRLWACNAAGTEIYATKLGDPFNWNTFEGISTDSWAVTIGSHGEFTGATTYLGYPTFFKEDSLIKIAISAQGAHATKETVCRGVQKGCSDAIIVVDEMLIYKSPSGIMAYDGSLPSDISQKLGDLTNFKNCKAGRNKSLYYINGSMNGAYTTFILDKVKGMWTAEKGEHLEAFATADNVLYASDGMEIIAYDNQDFIAGDDEIKAAIPFSFVTKDFDYSTPDNKYIHRMTVKAKMDFKARVDVDVEYDQDGQKHRICTLMAKGVNVFPINILPRRCNSFRLYFAGKGDVTIMNITRSLSEGGEKV